MKTETKSRIIENAKFQILCKDYLALRLGPDGRLIAPHPCHGWSQPFTLPQELLTSELKILLEVAAQAREAKHQRQIVAFRIQRDKEEAEFDGIGPRFTLLAGEETEILHHGTFRECLANLWKVLRCPRDHYAGKGAWIISGPAGEVRSGCFDKDMYW